VQQPLVKICGLTRPEDVLFACDAGADAIGFVFARSPRQISAELARALVRRVGSGVLRVGLFMDQDAALVSQVLDQVELDLLQFHGSETNGWCAAFGTPFLKAVAMQGEDWQQQVLSFPEAAGILLDSHAPGGAGGTGETFDWTRKVGATQPLWLAGGLHPSNVAEAVRAFRPHAVDVSSGVESAPGIKQDDRVKLFIDNAKQALQ